MGISQSKGVAAPGDYLRGKRKAAV